MFTTHILNILWFRLWKIKLIKLAVEYQFTIEKKAAFVPFKRHSQCLVELFNGRTHKRMHRYVSRDVVLFSGHDYVNEDFSNDNGD